MVSLKQKVQVLASLVCEPPEMYGLYELSVEHIFLLRASPSSLSPFTFIPAPKGVITRVG